MLTGVVAGAVIAPVTTQVLAVLLQVAAPSLMGVGGDSMAQE